MITVLDIERIKLTSINEKFGINPKTKTMYLNKGYRDFKNMIALLSKGCMIDPPYSVTIKYSGYIDIDNFLKPLIDGLQESGRIDNDKNVHHLEIFKQPLKRGREGYLKIYIERIIKTSTGS